MSLPSSPAAGSGFSITERRLSRTGANVPVGAFFVPIMRVERLSPAKINLVLNVLGRRADGFHDLETVMHPLPLADVLELDRGGRDIRLTCNLPGLPADGSNLVVKAAELFRTAAGVSEGVAIRLEKRIPLAAGLGGGSSNAAATLMALNELFGHPLEPSRIEALAASLGSDVPFFLRATPALATGRGEKVEPLGPCVALADCWVLLIHPGFGIATAWAYRELSRFPAALNGEPGRARRCVEALQARGPLARVGGVLYNALEAPAFAKYPILELYLEHLRNAGAAAGRMSGSGSTTFALFEDEPAARQAEAGFVRRFGDTGWVQAMALSGAGSRRTP
jgi:4-diphosphocytidyl-2-C-methyl-D-erythritol kinase